ncbi:hypothetical protein B5P43_08895 [Bacillus sp. SRB_336]|nr:hypothetical protein B5P43_08895 [Bacillus sp. SRB_336]
MAVGAATGSTSSTHSSDEGYVFASMPKGGNPDISVTSVQGGRKYDLGTLVGTKIPSAGMWLPAGDYTISAWNGQDFGPYPSFHVEAGRLTDLGALVSVDVGGHKFVVLPLRLEQEASAIAPILANLRPSLTSGQLVPWNPRGIPQPLKYPTRMVDLGVIANLITRYGQRLNTPPLREQLLKVPDAASFFAVIKESSPPLPQAGVADDQGNLYYGADFGQVRRRSPDGQWKAFDTGVLAKVTVIVRHGAALVAGYDDGSIRQSNDGGLSWHQVTSLDCANSVVDLSWSGTRWLATSVDMSLDANTFVHAGKFCFYASSGDDMTGLTKIKEMQSSVPIMTVPPHAVVSAGNYWAAVPPDLMRLDLKSMTWSRAVLPGPIEGFDVSANGGVISAFHAQGMFSKLYVSRDMAMTWEKAKSPHYVVRDVVFNDAGQGVAVRSQVGMFLLKLELYKSDSFGKSWTIRQKLPEECLYLIDDPRRMPQSCVTRGGSIISIIGAPYVEYARD